MSKKFNIHEWQASQIKKRLKENFANQKYYDLLNDLRDEGHLHRYGVIQLQLKFGLKEKEAQEIYNQYKEDLKAEQPDAYDFYMKDLNEDDSQIKDEIKKYIGQTFASWMSPSNPPFAQEYAKPPYIDDLVNGIIGILPTRMSEHHGDDFPKELLKKSVNDFLESLKKKSEKDYDAVEDIMRKYFGKEMDEMNSLGSAGAGASFQAGNSDAYATPKAFGGSKNKKEVLGYKKVKDLNEQNSPKWWKKIK